MDSLCRVRRLFRPSPLLYLLYKFYTNWRIFFKLDSNVHPNWAMCRTYLTLVPALTRTLVGVWIAFSDSSRSWECKIQSSAIKSEWTVNYVPYFYQSNIVMFEFPCFCVPFQYAFGSFIARDSTYRFLVSMWKKSQETKVTSLATRCLVTWNKNFSPKKTNSSNRKLIFHKLLVLYHVPVQLWSSIESFSSQSFFSSQSHIHVSIW